MPDVLQTEIQSSGRAIGCLGLGLLGSAMARRLLEHGWQVTGFDLDPQRGRELEHAGAIVTGSAAAVAQLPLVLLCLPTSDVVSAVLSGIGDDLRRGTILIDATTGHPDDTVQTAAGLAARGVSYLDATVGGSSRQVCDGEAIIMCGGERSVFDACRDVFQALARESFYVGPSGSGARMKLVVNLVLGLHRAVLAEGLAFAEATGVDPRTALDILKASPAASRVMETKGEKMLNRDFEPQARLVQHLKDVRLILESGAAAGARLPLSTLHRELLESLTGRGDGDLDNSAIIKAFDAGL